MSSFNDNTFVYVNAPDYSGDDDQSSQVIPQDVPGPLAPESYYPHPPQRPPSSQSYQHPWPAHAFQQEERDQDHYTGFDHWDNVAQGDAATRIDEWYDSDVKSDSSSTNSSTKPNALGIFTKDSTPYKGLLFSPPSGFARPEQTDPPLRACEYVPTPWPTWTQRTPPFTLNEHEVQPLSTMDDDAYASIASPALGKGGFYERCTCTAFNPFAVWDFNRIRNVMSEAPQNRPPPIQKPGMRQRDSSIWSLDGLPEPVWPYPTLAWGSTCSSLMACRNPTRHLGLISHAPVAMSSKFTFTSRRSVSSTFAKHPFVTRFRPSAIPKFAPLMSTVSVRNSSESLTAFPLPSRSRSTGNFGPFCPTDSTPPPFPTASTDLMNGSNPFVTTTPKAMKVDNAAPNSSDGSDVSSPNSFFSFESESPADSDRPEDDNVKSDHPRLTSTCLSKVAFASSPTKTIRSWRKKIPTSDVPTVSSSGPLQPRRRATPFDTVAAVIRSNSRKHGDITDSHVESITSVGAIGGNKTGGIGTVAKSSSITRTLTPFKACTEQVSANESNSRPEKSGVSLDLSKYHIISQVEHEKNYFVILGDENGEEVGHMILKRK